MPDITMCSDATCAKRKRCYRFVAKPDHYQSYFSGSPRHAGGSCDYYWDIRPTPPTPQTDGGTKSATFSGSHT